MRLKDLFDINVDVDSQANKITGNSILAGSLNNKTVIIKILNKGFDIKHLETELAWQVYLSERGLRTPKVCISRNNRYFEIIEIDGEDRVVIVMEKIEGKVMDNIKPTKDNVEKLGLETAKMHNLSDSFLEKHPNIKTPEWDEDPHVVIGEWMLRDRRLSESAKEIINKVRGLPKNEENYGIVHSDLQPHNLILSGTEIYFIDFESILKHWLIVDFVSSLEGFESNDIGNVKNKGLVKEFTSTYFNGYMQLRSVSPDMIESIPLFYTLWQIVLYNDLTGKWDMKNLSEKRQKWIENCKDNIISQKEIQSINFHKLIN